MRDKCRDLLNFFGYSKVEGKKNPFGFFEYEDLSDDEVKSYGKFAELNKE